MIKVKSILLTSHLTWANASPDKSWSRNFLTATSWKPFTLHQQRQINSLKMDQLNSHTRITIKSPLPWPIDRIIVLLKKKKNSKSMSLQRCWSSHKILIDLLNSLPQMKKCMKYWALTVIQELLHILPFCSHQVVPSTIKF